MFVGLVVREERFPVVQGLQLLRGQTSQVVREVRFEASSDKASRCIPPSHHVVAPSLPVYPPVRSHIIHLPINPHINRLLSIRSIIPRQLHRCQLNQLAPKWIKRVLLYRPQVRSEIRHGVESVCFREKMTQEREEDDGDEDC